MQERTKLGVGEVAGAELNALDPFHEYVHGFGGAVAGAAGEVDDELVLQGGAGAGQARQLREVGVVAAVGRRSTQQRRGRRGRRGRARPPEGVAAKVLALGGAEQDPPDAVLGSLRRPMRPKLSCSTRRRTMLIVF